MSSFFQKIGSFVSSAVGSKSKIPYDIEDNETGRSGLWSMHKAKKDDKNFSAFIFDKVKNRNRLEESLALSEVKRLRALRHPGIVHYVFHHESEEQIVMITEHLSLLNLKEETEITKLFGCYNILKALNFLHKNGLFHYHINPDAVFVDKRKMWKLGALGCLTKIDDPYSTPTEFPIHKFSQVITKRYPLYRSPELNQKKWSILVRYPHATDVYSIGLLLFDVFEGAQIDHSDQIVRSALRSLPKSLRRNTMRLLLHSNPSKRPPVEDLVKNAAFQNELFDIFEFVERVPVEQDTDVLERNLTNLLNNIEQFPSMYTQNRVLPQLFHALLYGAGQLKKNTDGSTNQSVSVQSIVTPQLKMYQIIFRVGSTIEDSKVYRRLMIPPLYKILCSTDTMPIYHQIKVIEQISQIVPHAESKFLKYKIFPILSSGLSQSRSSNLREACVKSVVPLIPQLEIQQQIVDVLVPTFFNLLKDQKKSVRANAVIAVGMMTPHLARKKSSKHDLLDLFVLPFFARALKYDNFSYSKIYALKAIKTTIAEYNFVQLCRSVLPIITPWLISRNREIRETAFDCFKDTQMRIMKVFETQTVESELNRILGVVSAPSSISSTSSSGGGSGGGNGMTGTSSSEGKAERLKVWASTLFLGKQAVEEDQRQKALERAKEVEEKVRKEKKAKEERKWMEEIQKRELEEVRRMEERKSTLGIGRGGRPEQVRTYSNQGRPIPAVVLGRPEEEDGEEDEEDEDYVQSFLEETDSPIGRKKKPTRIGGVSTSRNSRTRNKIKKKSESGMFGDLDEHEDEFDRARSYNQSSQKNNSNNDEDWEIGWGDLDNKEDNNQNRSSRTSQRHHHEEDTDEDLGKWENIDQGVSWDDEDEEPKKPKKREVKKTVPAKRSPKKKTKKKQRSEDPDLGWGGFEDDENDSSMVKKKKKGDDYAFWGKDDEKAKMSTTRSTSRSTSKSTKSKKMGSPSKMFEEEEGDGKVVSGSDFWKEQKEKEQKAKKKKKQIENEFEGLINFDDF